MDRMSIFLSSHLLVIKLIPHFDEFNVIKNTILLLSESLYTKKLMRITCWE